MSAASSPPSLTAVVITKNEAHQITACLDTLRFTDRVLVVDSGSDDGTREIAAAAGAEAVLEPFIDFARQRNFGLDRTRTEWALVIDADERVTPELAVEIRAALAHASADPKIGAFRILRRNHFMGRPLSRSLCGTERLTRLLRARRATFVNAVHETPVVDGEIRNLTAPMEHLTHVRLRDAFEKALRYAILWAHDKHARGRTTSLAGIAVHTVHRWFKIYLFEGAVFEGTRGFILAGFESVGVFFKYALLWELQRRDR